MMMHLKPAEELGRGNHTTVHVAGLLPMSAYCAPTTTELVPATQTDDRRHLGTRPH